MSDINISVTIDPKPIDIHVDMLGGGGGRVDEVVAGDGVTVDASDPARPIVSAEGGGAVSSVNGQTGAVTLDAADVGADPAGAADAVTLASLDGVAADDPRLTDARTPTAHAATHAAGGSDPITPESIGAATSAQGVLADSAVQPGDLAAVATSGAYGDLTGTPSIPDVSDVVRSDDVTTVAAVTQAVYDGLTPDGSTLYVVTE